jgi:hypothetical protein
MVVEIALRTYRHDRHGPRRLGARVHSGGKCLDPETVTESEHHQQVGALDARKEAGLPARKRAKVGRRRQRRTSLAAQVFRPTI